LARSNSCHAASSFGQQSEFVTLRLPSYDRALHALRTLLDSWSGIGHVSVGMARQGYDLQLTRYDEKGWRATFYTTGMEHSPTSATGTGWERTPWLATQRAVWEALKASDQANLTQPRGDLTVLQHWRVL
jgi:hypothetical protein